MSTIPVVNQLGDELERAARRSSARLRSRRRRRLGMLAVAGALVASGTALATGLISGGVEQQATASIACYDGADPDFSGSVAVVPREAGSAGPSPVQLCRRELAVGGRAVTPLVACAHEAGVAVIPGRRASDCRHAGFTPLDPAYEPARRRAARLERAVLGVEASADCIAPGQLARRVRALLERSGWRGWTVTVDPARGDGPCGSISYFGGDGRRYIEFDQAERRLEVSRAGSRRVTNLLYSERNSLLLRLFRESGGACFTPDGLRRRIQDVFGAHGLTASVRSHPHPRGSALDDDDGRWTRYQSGCAVLAGGAPGPGRNDVSIEVFVKP